MNIKKYCLSYLLLFAIHVAFWVLAIIIANDVVDLLMVIGLITYSIIHMVISFHMFMDYIRASILEYVIKHAEYLTKNTIISKWINMKIKYTNKTPIELLDVYITSLDNISFENMMKRNISICLLVFSFVILCMFI